MFESSLGRRVAGRSLVCLGVAGNLGLPRAAPKTVGSSPTNCLCGERQLVVPKCRGFPGSQDVASPSRQTSDGIGIRAAGSDLQLYRVQSVYAGALVSTVPPFVRPFSVPLAAQSPVLSAVFPPVVVLAVSVPALRLYSFSRPSSDGLGLRYRFLSCTDGFGSILNAQQRMLCQCVCVCAHSGKKWLRDRIGARVTGSWRARCAEVARVDSAGGGVLGIVGHVVVDNRRRGAAALRRCPLLGAGCFDEDSLCERFAMQRFGMELSLGEARAGCVDTWSAFDVLPPCKV